MKALPPKQQHASATRGASEFQIGIVRTSLRTSIRRLRRQYGSLYSHLRVAPGDQPPIRVEVDRTPISLRHRRRYQVRVNGRLLFEPVRADEVLPYVEWAVSWEIPRFFPNFLQIHASAMQMEGMGVILPGLSGSGKSTLAAGLLARGWRYLCDEFAMIHAETFALHPYPRAICVKKPSFEAVRDRGLILHGNAHHHKRTKGYVGFINPADVRDHAIGHACPIRLVVFPTYRAGATPTLISISRAEAAFALQGVCFNLLTCRRPGLDVLTGMIRGASCYRLVSGELGETCDLMDQLVQENKLRVARSA